MQYCSAYLRVSKQIAFTKKLFESDSKFQPTKKECTKLQTFDHLKMKTHNIKGGHCMCKGLLFL